MKPKGNFAICEYGSYDVWAIRQAEDSAYYDIKLVAPIKYDDKVIGQARKTYQGMWEIYDGERFKQFDEIEAAFYELMKRFDI